MSGVLDLSRDVVTSCYFFPAEHNVPPGTPNHSGHTLPEQAIAMGALTKRQYDEYDHYTIIRNPIDRWISAYAFRCRMHMDEKITPQDFFLRVKDDNVVKRQSDYLTLGRVQTFRFSEYEKSIKTIVAAVGGHLEDVPKLEHKTRQGWTRRARHELDLSDVALREKLLARYSDDIALEY